MHCDAILNSSALSNTQLRKLRTSARSISGSGELHSLVYLVSYKNYIKMRFDCVWPIFVEEVHPLTTIQPYTFFESDREGGVWIFLESAL